MELLGRPPTPFPAHPADVHYPAPSWGKVDPGLRQMPCDRGNNATPRPNPTPITFPTVLEQEANAHRLQTHTGIVHTRLDHSLLLDLRRTIRVLEGPHVMRFDKPPTHPTYIPEPELVHAAHIRAGYLAAAKQGASQNQLSADLHYVFPPSCNDLSTNNPLAAIDWVTLDPYYESLNNEDKIPTRPNLYEERLASWEQLSRATKRDLIELYGPWIANLDILRHFRYFVRHSLNGLLIYVEGRKWFHRNENGDDFVRMPIEPYHASEDLHALGRVNYNLYVNSPNPLLTDREATLLTYLMHVLQQVKRVRLVGAIHSLLYTTFPAPDSVRRLLSHGHLRIPSFAHRPLRHTPLLRYMPDDADSRREDPMDTDEDSALSSDDGWAPPPWNENPKGHSA
jgi:hypothetical protein